MACSDEKMEECVAYLVVSQRKLKAMKLPKFPLHRSELEILYEVPPEAAGRLDKSCTLSST